MKREMAALRAEVKDLRAIDHRMVSALVRLEDKIDTIGERMARKDDIRALHTRMDGFVALAEDSRHRWAIHAGTLSEYDRRLLKLESRRD